MGHRMTTRALPVLDIAPPVTGPAGPRDPLAPSDERLAEFRPRSARCRRSSSGRSAAR